MLLAASARGYHYGARKYYPRGKPGLSGAVAHLAAWTTELAEEVRSLPQRIRNEHASHVKVPLRANRMPDLLPLY